ncbi:MAG: amidohydrolase family protein [Actinobacteria bacterium]|nr:amidohydrolase family protein [Actinomycetota bacterium]
MPLIVDAHAHLETPVLGVTPDPGRRRTTHLLMWSYELLGFRNPLWKGEPPGAARALIAMENQLRLSMGCKKNLLRSMERNGIDRSVVLPIAPFSSSREYLDACEGEHRLIPFASACPAPGWEKELGEAMERGCRGLKIHPILQRIAPEDRFYFDLLEEFSPHRRPVLIHAGEFDYYVVRDGFSSYGDTSRYEKLIRAFPEVPFILGHMGLYYPQKALRLAERYENVFLETSFQPLKVVREALRVAGRERVVFGSDWPESDPRYALRIARRAAGEDGELLRRLTGGNILALLG